MDENSRKTWSSLCSKLKDARSKLSMPSKPPPLRADVPERCGAREPSLSRSELQRATTHGQRRPWPVTRESPQPGTHGQRVMPAPHMRPRNERRTDPCCGSVVSGKWAAKRPAHTLSPRTTAQQVVLQPPKARTSGGQLRNRRTIVNSSGGRSSRTKELSSTSIASIHNTKYCISNYCISPVLLLTNGAVSSVAHTSFLHRRTFGYRSRETAIKDLEKVLSATAVASQGRIYRNTLYGDFCRYES